MQEKRIFIGSFVRTEKLLKNFPVLQQDFNNDNRISWTRTPENFHLTFYFLGNTPIDQISEIQNFLKNKYPFILPMDLKILGVNFFKRKNKPSILYANIEKNEGLNHIFNEITQFLLRKKIVNNINLRFHPHITMGRIKKNSPDFYNKIEKYKNMELGEQNGIKIEIIESKLSPEGALYKPLKIKI